MPPTAPSFLNHHFFANEGGRNPWHGTRVGEASNPGPANPGTLCLPDSKRHKTGPKVHVPVKYKPDGEVGRIRRSTITPKDSTDRIRYRWQATAPGRIRCASQDLITPAIALQSWFRKHHQLLTDDRKDELARELNKRILGTNRDTTRRHTPPSTPLSPTMLKEAALAAALPPSFNVIMTILDRWNAPTGVRATDMDRTRMTMK